MVSLFLVLCLGLGERINLPGSATPMAAWQVQRGTIWLVRQDEGGLPNWWVVQGTKAAPVEPVLGLRFAEPTPDGRALVMLTADELIMWGPTEGQEQGTIIWRTPIPEPLGASQPWRHMTITGDQTRVLGGFYNRGHYRAWIMELGNSPKVQWFRYGGTTSPGGEAEALSGRNMDFRAVNPIVEEDRLAWLNHNNYQVWHPLQDKLVTHNIPATEDMEVALALPSKEGAPYWFVYGGARGSFSSFGWRLLEANGQQAFSGNGIVVRYGWDRQSKQPRLLVFTVSNQIQSQVWASLRGTTTFTCNVLIRDGQRWRMGASHEIPISKDKSKNRKPIVFHWQSDWNNDGWNDLLISDAKRGMRLYPSLANGDFETKPKTLNKAPLRVLPTRIGALRADRARKGWLIEAVPWRP